MGGEKTLGFAFITSIFLYLMLFGVQDSIAQNLRICEIGLKNCERFISNKDKYKQCLIEECNQQKTEPRSYFEVTEEFDNIEYIESCDYGLRRCDPYKDNKQIFWECVRDSCENAPEKYDPTCYEGRNQCIPNLKTYSNCLQFNCPRDESGKVQECMRGAKNCSQARDTYWHCVYGVCLGDVGIYALNRVKRKYIRVKDSEGNIIKLRIDRNPSRASGVPEGLKDAPQGVNREEYIRNIPSRYLLTGNPSSKLVCFRPYVHIKCFSQDIRSCSCMDGSVPIFRNGAPKPITQEEWDSMLGEED